MSPLGLAEGEKMSELSGPLNTAPVLARILEFLEQEGTFFLLQARKLRPNL